GLLNGAKPRRAPHNASATDPASGGAAPNTAKTKMLVADGTASATVIQSMPSMKLTRLTNHSPATISPARSIAIGTTGTARSSAGIVHTVSVTATACTARRHIGAIGNISSTAPTTVKSATAAPSGSTSTSAVRSGPKNAPSAPSAIAI